MKKGIRKLLSALLIATLVFGSAGMAFADTGKTESKGGMSATAEKHSAALQDSQNSSMPFTKAASNKAISATTKAQSSQLPLTILNTGDETINGYYFNAITQVLTVTAPAKGTIMLKLAGNLKGTGFVNVGLYSDAACKQAVGSYAHVTGTNKDNLVADVPRGGTYYLRVYASESTPVSGTVNVWGAFAYGTDTTLSNNTWHAVGSKKSGTNYFKFKANNTGYIKVDTQSYSGYITLTNSKKKSVSNRLYGNQYAVFGVKKGATYYLKMDTNSNYSNGAYRLKVTNSKITEKSGKKKSKAVKIKRNKTKKGTIIAGNKQADWYKFKLTKKKTVKFTFKGRTNDKIKITVYKGKKKVGTKTLYYTHAGMTLKSYGKWEKGNYYVKIYRGNSKSSGYYSLKWK